MPSSRLIIGAMSGTSADGVDAALVRIEGIGANLSARILAHCHRAYSRELRESIFALRASGSTSLTELARIGRDVSLAYSAAVNELLTSSNTAAEEIAAIAAHGQTLYHAPPNTIQWLDPALVAAKTGCAVISDFRRADCAAGGQGAPLVPFTDYVLFRSPTRNRVLLNIGGIANLTWLPAGGTIEQVIAFDTGPGNCISDHLIRLNDPAGCGWDVNGAAAARGKVIDELARRVLKHEYFALKPPRSTDGPAMIQIFMDAVRHQDVRHSREDLLHTACAITAQSISRAIREFLPAFPDEVIVSGGGARNTTLMTLLGKELGTTSLRTTEELNVVVDAKEALAFALLGAATLDGYPSNVPAATGARRAVVLGSLTPRQAGK